MKLGLGTAQFGLDYGITNRDGQISHDEAHSIVSLALDAGIEVFDTARSYGESERVLGACLSKLRPARPALKIVSKLPGVSGPVIREHDLELQRSMLDTTLECLKTSSLYGLLLHRPADLLLDGGAALYDWLQLLKADGVVQKVGISIYDRAELDTLLSRYRFDLVQLALNVLDQRLLNDGTLRALKAENCEVHARSVFLQGLLIANPAALPQHFKSVTAHLEHYHQTCESYGISPLQAALCFALSQESVDVVLCGVTTAKQLSEILAAATRMESIPELSQFAWSDPAILNPSLWAV